MEKQLSCRLYFEGEFREGERRFLVATSAVTSDHQQTLSLDEIKLFKSTKLIVPMPGEPDEWLIGAIKREARPEAQPLRPPGPDMTAVFFREGGQGGGVMWPAFPPRELQIEIVYNGILPKKLSFFVDGSAVLVSDG